MKTNKTAFFLLFFFLNSLLPISGWGQDISDYTLTIDKRNADVCNIHVCCAFNVDFRDKDSLWMAFGGDEELSIEHLKVEGDYPVTHDYIATEKKILFHCQDKRKVNIQMEYDYTNLTSAFVYGRGDAEIWETSYGEFYYPYIPHTCVDTHINILLPDSLELIAAYATEKAGKNRYHCSINQMLAESFSFAFIRKDVYTQSVATIPDTIQVYQITDMQCGAKRYNELLDLVSKSIPYFSRVYKEDYLSLAKNITSYPTFLFHNGEGFSNRYNVGFISASQEKFSTYPDIFPLIHEIGHRWLGEWTLWIEDGEPGALFIKESLNEFMTLMFIRDNLGKELYTKYIEEYRNEYREIENTSKDAPIIEVTTNTNNTVVYRKGPLLLDHIAQKIGYQNLIEVISRFYQCYANKKPLHYNDFIEVLSNQYPDAGKELDDLIRRK